MCMSVGGSAASATAWCHCRYTDRCGAIWTMRFAVRCLCAVCVPSHQRNSHTHYTWCDIFLLSATCFFGLLDFVALLVHIYLYEHNLFFFFFFFSFTHFILYFYVIFCCPFFFSLLMLFLLYSIQACLLAAFYHFHYLFIFKFVQRCSLSSLAWLRVAVIILFTHSVRCWRGLFFSRLYHAILHCASSFFFLFFFHFCLSEMGHKPWFVNIMTISFNERPILCDFHTYAHCRNVVIKFLLYIRIWTPDSSNVGRGHRLFSRYTFWASSILVAFHFSHLIRGAPWIFRDNFVNEFRGACADHILIVSNWHDIYATHLLRSHLQERDYKILFRRKSKRIDLTLFLIILICSMPSTSCRRA